jgi:hypothetical protein
MARGILYTAIYKEKEYTLSVKYWGLLIGRSKTFLRKHIQIAADKGYSCNAQMQYAIEQKPCYRTKRVGKEIVRDKVVTTAQDKENEQVRKYNSMLFNMARV